MVFPFSLLISVRYWFGAEDWIFESGESPESDVLEVKERSRRPTEGFGGSNDDSDNDKCRRKSHVHLSGHESKACKDYLHG